MAEREIFLSFLNDAMSILQDYGHITDYRDLPDEINRKSVELERRMFDSFPDTEGLTPTDIAKFKAYCKWVKRLSIVGLFFNGGLVCFNCIDEKTWDVIEVFNHDDIIDRIDNEEGFTCKKCGKYIRSY